MNKAEKMKKGKNKKAMMISFVLHLSLILLAVIPMISMMKGDSEDLFENYQLIEIAFENGDMSPASASTKPGKPEIVENKKTKKEEVKVNVKNASEETTVLKNEDVSFEEDVEVVMEEGRQDKDLPIAEVEQEEIVATAETIELLGGDELSDEGEGDIGESMTGEALANMEFEGEGVFGRQIIYHANISKMAKKEGRVVVNLCIDRAGDVTHIAFNRDASSLTDSEYIMQVMKVAAKYKFEADYTAPRTQCGKLTFIFEFN